MCFVQQVDFLVIGHTDEPSQGRKKGCQQNGEENISWVGCTQLGPVNHNADGDDGYAACVDDQEHDLGV